LTTAAYPARKRGRLSSQSARRSGQQPEKAPEDKYIIDQARPGLNFRHRGNLQSKFLFDMLSALIWLHQMARIELPAQWATSLLFFSQDGPIL